MVDATDLRGASRLVIDATLGLTELVETMHHNILRVPGIFGTATNDPAGGITGLVYRSIRGVTRLVGGSIDVALSQLVPLLGQPSHSITREAILAALNGVLGDHLVASGNPLAITMQFRREGQVLPLSRTALAGAIPKAASRIVLLIHGLCMNDLQWQRNGHDHGASLYADLAMGADANLPPPMTAIYLHYNSGRHISVNGRELAGMLEKLVAAWPVPLQQLDIIGHSMGGLVARSACHYAAENGHAWPKLLRKMIFLGSPHEGAPLERGGNYVNVLLDASPYTTAFSRLAKIRSAGITDLRHSALLDENWHASDRFAGGKKPAIPFVPLPDGVTCYAIAATTSSKISAAKKPVESLSGDGLVPVASALGHSKNPGHRLGIPKSRQWVGHDMNHMDLLSSKAVYRRLRKWLATG